MKKCKVDGCGKPHDSNGYCGMHNVRLKRYGDVHCKGNRDHHKRFLNSLTRNKNTGCLEWIKTVDKDGYGVLFLLGDKMRAHRYSWEYHNKKPIPSGMMVCHICDNPKCCEPSHLYVGTALDNNTDRVVRGRGSVGERHYKSKLSEDDVIAIRNNNNMSGPALAKKYSVTHRTIYLIKKNLIWKHLK